MMKAHTVTGPERHPMPEVPTLNRVPLRSRKTKTWSEARLKRVFDLSIAVPMLVCALPVLGSVAMIIKTTSSGPILFRQRRVGQGQRLFTIYKFRTMHAYAEMDGPSVTRKGDQRLTRVGSMLRRLKLDELPQLYNVIVGEMSLVGPRPKLASHEKMNLHCRPGITGAATLVFAREEEILARVPEEYVESYTVHVLNPIKARLDTEYAERGTFVSDLRILAGTVLRLGRRHAITMLPELSEVDLHSEFRA